MDIRYIGNKPIKEDNIAGTGLIWVGRGDVKSVPDALWPKFAAHPNVWERTDGVKPEAFAASPIEAAAPKTTIRYWLEGEDGEVVNLDVMEDADLKAFAKTHNIDVDLRKKGDALRAAIVESAGAATGA